MLSKHLSNPEAHIFTLQEQTNLFLIGKNLLIVMVPLSINKDVLVPSYNDLKFTIQNHNYFCSNLIHLLTKVRTGRETTDWLQIGKGVHQGYILSPYLFNLCAGYIMRNAGLDEAQAGIKIARRNIYNLRNADDTTLMAESEEELKSLFKEESEKVGLKLNIQKTKIMASGPIT